MTDLIPVTFSVFHPQHDQCRGDASEMLVSVYAKRWGGTNVIVTPTDVKGEFRVTGLFQLEFAEVRGYP